MLVRLSRQEFSALDDASLIWTCVEPAVRLMRSNNLKLKPDIAPEINKSQRALLMYQLISGHAMNGVLSFYSMLSYLLLKDVVWTELKKGIEYFGENTLAELVSDMENTYRFIRKDKLREDSEWLDLESIVSDLQLMTAMDALDNRLFSILPASEINVSMYIRNNPAEFVIFKD